MNAHCCLRENAFFVGFTVSLPLSRADFGLGRRSRALHCTLFLTADRRKTASILIVVHSEYLLIVQKYKHFSR